MTLFLIISLIQWEMKCHLELQDLEIEGEMLIFIYIRFDLLSMTKGR